MNTTTRIQYDTTLINSLLLVRLEMASSKHSKKDKAGEALITSTRGADHKSTSATTRLFAPQDIDPLTGISTSIRNDFTDPKWTMSFTGKGSKIAWRVTPTGRFLSLRAEFEPRIERRRMLADTIANDWTNVLARAQTFRAGGFSYSDYPDNPWDWAAGWEGKIHRDIMTDGRHILLDAGQELIEELRQEKQADLKRGLDEALTDVTNQLVESLEIIGVAPRDAKGVVQKDRKKFAASLHENPAHLAGCLRQTLLDLRVQHPALEAVADQAEQFAADVAGRWDQFKEDEDLRNQEMRRALELAQSIRSIDL